MIPAIDAYPKWKQEAIKCVSKDGMNLTAFWATDKDIVRVAIKNNPFAICLAKPFQDNFEIAKLALSINGLAYLWISDNLKKDRELIRLSRKTLPRTLKGPDVELPKQRSVYYISGNYCEPLKILAGFHDIYDLLIPVSLQSEECSIFIRDSRVALVEGQNLIPHQVYDNLYRQLVFALLPSTASNLLIDPVSNDVAAVSLGMGFYTKNVLQSALFSYELHLPFKMARTCIEGGNAYSFKINSRPFLIVGEMSLYLSLIALDNARYFKGKPFDSSIEPSEDAYRIAKNLERYLLFRRPIEKIKPSGQCEEDDLQHFGGELGYRSLLVQPIAESEKPAYRDRAIQITGFIQLTKERIAYDTKTPIDNIIFFAQKYFHIDLDTFVTPKGEVVLHDDDLAITLLSHLLKTLTLTEDEKNLLEDYLKTATENNIRYKQAMKLRKEILIKKNIPYHLIPGSFVSEKYKSHLNYCNGVFLRKAKVIRTSVATIKQPAEGYIYLTTGPTYKEELIVHDRIKKLFNILFPKDTFREIPDLSKFISEMHGGFRCLSFESVPATEI